MRAHFTIRLTVCAAGIATACFCDRARGGDAVAVAYNAQGLWTAATYYCSGSPKGAGDYKDESGARDAAMRDLKRRAGDDLARAEVISSSDRTGHFAVARAKTAAGKEVFVVGYGKSPAEADAAAESELKRAGASGSPTIMYRYFSHGAESRAAR